MTMTSKATAKALIPAFIRLHEVLLEEGYGKVSVDDDGDLVFKAEGRTYVFLFDARDSEFLRLVFPNFWSVDDDEERALCLEASNEVTKTCKVARVYVSGEEVSGSVELLVPDAQGLNGKVVERLLAMMRNAVDTFVREMRRTDA